MYYYIIKWFLLIFCHCFSFVRQTRVIRTFAFINRKFQLTQPYQCIFPHKCSIKFTLFHGKAKSKNKQTIVTSTEWIAFMKTICAHLVSFKQFAFLVKLCVWCWNWSQQKYLKWIEKKPYYAEMISAPKASEWREEKKTEKKLHLNE